MPDYKEYKLTRDSELSPRVAIWFSQMQEIRDLVLFTINEIDDELLDFTLDERKIETIGTLLLHIAAVEWSWIFEDIDGLEMDFDEWEYAFPLRPDVNLPQLKGKGKKFYLDKIEKVRLKVYNRLKKFKDEDLDQLVGSYAMKFTIEWILHHILNHEIWHLGQILLIIRLYEIKENKLE
ncbi:MAG: DinB family protein [Candidatus Heimdallarchaeota archaeon]|nr:DinB family protein [Candidatus Heimdallarchaeota archaeon]